MQRLFESPAPAKLGLRLAWLAALFIAELIAISVRLDTQVLSDRGGFIGALGDAGSHILQSLIVFVAVFLAFGYAQASKKLPIDHLLPGPLRWSYFAGHLAAMAAFARLSAALFGGTAGAHANLAACAWIAAGLTGMLTGLLFFIPPQTLREILPNTGPAWAYAAVAAVVTPLCVVASGRLWAPATAVTFDLVQLFLKPFVSSVIADAVTKTVGTGRFSVQIAPGCSGMEGTGLMLVFGSVWLCFFHRDYRFPRALLLIPVGMMLMFLLNSVRITALILIGNGGAPSVALGGFHSQAGWIAFNGLALGLASVAHRIPWISARRPSATIADHKAENPTAAYLAPFLAILAAGMIATAGSGSFEWLYPLRLIAAAGVLLAFRKAYSKIDWRFGWPAPVIGGLVFLLWIILDPVSRVLTASGIAAGLAAWPPPARIAWLVCRTLAAVVTVPIAEELAFRGYLLRRLIAADFESVSLRHWTWLAVAGSSLAFGLMHGNRWIAATIAGFLYAGVQKWRGRLGDAVVAHAVSNALIAVWVLWGGHWSLW